MSGIKRYHWNGDESKNGEVVKFSDHVDEVAKCAINVEKVRGYEVAPLQAEIARLCAEVDAYKSLVSGIVDNRHKCFIPTDDPNSPTFNWDARADAAMGADA